VVSGFTHRHIDTNRWCTPHLARNANSGGVGSASNGASRRPPCTVLFTLVSVTVGPEAGKKMKESHSKSQSSSTFPL
jgi:hypothetical protein